MTILFLLLSPALFALFWIVRFQICSARRRRLIDTYGIDSKKLRKLGCKEVTKLRKQIQTLEEKKDAHGLESIVSPYRP
ncbi:hypothetical protein ICN19_05600 [Polynucleobacter sp. AP-Capit-er-40B-B4]|uniref:hypothetical protein n=1 Tax=Polynucleobacter sp. AP-Capit-er-40B-B4 TaxID=2576927 RepID=UPI001C0C3C3C|nr:hypothetical protein [Polynucleobacter sp. AP-Capit-er-40B-B4]MBU3581482.1 hypothetical protein [Polynucleobacter sp. AP-Capit-er-40B-B4]